MTRGARELIRISAVIADTVEYHGRRVYQALSRGGGSAAPRPISVHGRNCFEARPDGLHRRAILALCLAAAPSDISITMVNNRAALGATAPFRQVEVDGVKLAYNDDGVGPAIVCLHAIAHGAGDFAALREHLKNRYRVLALDWPGHGHSENDHEPASARRYARLLAGFMDVVNIERGVLIGNSIGGAAALLHAHAYPERVRGLVLEDPGGLVSTSDFVTRHALRVMIAFFRAGARSAWWFPAAYRAYYKRVLSNPRAAEWRVKIAAAGPEMAPILTEAWTSFAAPEADTRALVREITCPVLAAWAKHDQIVQWKRNEPVVRKFPDVHITIFDAGHAAHLETPEEFAGAVDRFLAEVGWTRGETATNAAAR